MNQTTKCQKCNEEVTLPFKCPFCDQYYCTQHRLPENHNCPEYWKVITPRRETPTFTIESKPQTTPYEYTVTYTPQPKTKIFWFSPTELKHLTLSTLLVMGVGLSWPLWSMGGLGNPEILIGLAAVFTSGYLLHELAHKLIAQHYGLWAEFRLTMFGAFITLLSIFSPIKLISPGAVLIAGPMSKKTAGKTALAGPLINLLLSLVSLVFVLYPMNPFSTVAWWSAAFNAWIALFNLIPFAIMDGLKVFQWNKLIWATVFITSIVLTIFTFVLE